MQHHNVVVVGAGPAGIAASKALSTSGLDVLLLDKTPSSRDKGCGGCLTPRSIKLLHKLFPNFKYPKKIINIIEFGYIKNESFKPLHRISIKKKFHTVNRAVFDDLLLKEAKKYGVKCLADKVKSITVKDNLFYIKGNEIISAEYIIVACGVFGPKLLNISDISFEVPKFSIIYHTSKEPSDNIIKIGYIENGYFWNFPQPQKHSTGTCFYENKPPYNLQTARDILGVNIENISATPIPFFEADKSFKNNNSFDGCLFAGDSAGFVDNWTGEGISFALKSGMEAALSIVKRYSRPDKVNDQYLYNVRIMAKHLILAEAFRKTFYKNFPESLELLKDRKLLKMFNSYINSFNRSSNRLFLKSLFTSVPRIIN